MSAAMLQLVRDGAPDPDALSIELRTSLTFEFKKENAADLDRAGDSTAPSVIMDLAGVDYMDSTGLSQLIALHRDVVKTGRYFEVVKVSPEVMQTFRRTATAKILNVTES